MASDDQETKTEEPSAKRLTDARSRGQTVQSREIAHLVMMGAMLVVILMLGPLMSRDMMIGLRRFLELPHQLRLDDGNFHALMLDLTYDLAVALALPLALLLLAAMAPSLLQHGFLFTTYNLEPKLERISILAGFKRLFSLRNTMELVKGILKMSIVGAVAVMLLMPTLGYAEQWISIDLQLILPELMRLTVRLLIGVIVVVMLLAGADYLYQRYEFMKSLRMSKQELKDEFKQMEGDPVIKSKVRQIRAQRARTRMMQAVPTATVVVTNPTHFAVALKYEQPMNAPTVVAKGMDLIALKIIDTARKNFVPVIENPPLARTLFANVELDDEIPSEHYKAVAEVIGYVMRLKKQAIH